MARDLLQHRTALVSALQLLMPERVNVEDHPGTFDLAELKRYMPKAPCVLISVLGYVDLDATAPQGPVAVAAYVLTRNGKQVERGEQNLQLCSLLLALCKSSLLQDDSAGRPAAMRYKNLYSGYLDEEGVALGSVSWMQHLELPAPVESVEDFLALHANYRGDALPSTATDDASPAEEQLLINPVTP